MLKWNNTNQNKGIACDNNEKERGLIKKTNLARIQAKAPSIFSAPLIMKTSWPQSMPVYLEVAEKIAVSPVWFKLAHFA